MLTTPAQRDWQETRDRVARLGVSQRVDDIDALEKLWTGHAYDGRPSFWDKSVPLQERAPVVVDPVL
jgi:hypothetical protein